MAEWKGMKVILGGIGILIMVVLLSQLAKLRSPQEIVGPKLGAEFQSAVALSTVPEIKIGIYPSDLIYQGEALRVELEGERKILNPVVVFRGKEFKFFDYQGKLNAIIPVAIDAPPGETDLMVAGKNLPVKILPGIFQSEEIGPFKPLTSAELAQRQEEIKSISAAYSSIAPIIYFKSSFTPPLEKLVETSPFGVQRRERGTNRKLEPHNGVDLRADFGTPVMAANDGVVEIAENYLLEGGFVLIDHGLGINSGYLHLSRVDVKNGEQVKKGQIIGLTGGSGVSAGPHLHFMIKINGTAVDPLRFLDLWK